MNTKTTAPNVSGFPKSVGSQAFENGSSQAKATYDKMASATTDAHDAIKNSASAAVKGAQEYNSKFMEFAHANTNAAFDFFKKMLEVKSPTSIVELSTEHARKHLETLTEQSNELAALGQKVTVAATEPLKAGLTKGFGPAA